MSAHARLLEALAAGDLLPVRREGDGHAHARCPAHEDRQPSLSVGTGRDGRVLLHCHRGCSPEDILAALELDWPDLFDGEPPKPYTLAGLRRAGASL